MERRNPESDVMERTRRNLESELAELREQNRVSQQRLLARQQAGTHDQEEIENMNAMWYG